MKDYLQPPTKIHCFCHSCQKSFFVVVPRDIEETLEELAKNGCVYQCQETSSTEIRPKAIQILGIIDETESLYDEMLAEGFLKGVQF